MLECEGFKMFRGTMVIEPIKAKPFKLTGTWLYKPEWDCWYCAGHSFPSEICTIYEDETE